MSALILLAGAPGCGKTTWRTGRFPTSAVVCLDEYRVALTGDMGDQSANIAAVSIMDIVVRERLARGLLTVVDATNTRPEYRLPLIGHAARNKMPVIAVVFHSSNLLCTTRVAARPGNNAIPAEVIRRHNGQLRAHLADLIGSVHFAIELNSTHRVMRMRVTPSLTAHSAAGQVTITPQLYEVLDLCREYRSPDGSPPDRLVTLKAAGLAGQIAGQVHG